MELDETLADLRAALAEAMDELDQPAITALRSAISALEKARRGVTGDDSDAFGSDASSDDDARYELTEHEVRFVLEGQVDRREVAAASFERLGQDDRADQLRAEADALSPWVN